MSELGLFDSKFIFTFGKTKIEVIDEGVPNAINQLQDICKEVLKRGAYDLRACMEQKQDDLTAYKNLTAFVNAAIKEKDAKEKQHILENAIYLYGFKD